MMYVRFLSDYMTTPSRQRSRESTRQRFFEEFESFHASLLLLKHPFTYNSADKRPLKDIVVCFSTEDERV